MSPNSIRRTSKNTAMLFGGTLTRMVASFALVLYAARKLGVEGFGGYSIAIHYFELVLSLSATAVGILLIRDLARWTKQQNHLLTSAALLLAVLSMVATAGMLALSVLCGFQPTTKVALQLISLATIPASFCVLFEAAFVAKERAEFVMLGTSIESGLRIGLSLAALWLGFGVLALVGIFIVVRCLLFVCYGVCLHRIAALTVGFSTSADRTICQTLAGFCRGKLDGDHLHQPRCHGPFDHGRRSRGGIVQRRL